MNLHQFTADRRTDWSTLNALVDESAGKPERLGSEKFAAAARLYRASTADLAYARRKLPNDPVTNHLEQLVGRANSLVYGNLQDRRGFVWFLTTGYWQRVRERSGLLLLSLVLIFGPIVWAGVWAHSNPVEAGRVLPDIAAAAEQPPPNPDRNFSTDTSTGFAVTIFTNNARVALVAFAGGITLGLFTGYLLLTNGLLVGLLGGLEIAHANGSTFFQLIVPHGVLELSLIAVAGTAGFRLADAILRPGVRPRIERVTSEGRACIELALGTALLLVPCGLVEGFVTPAGLGLPAGLTIGVALGVAFWGLVLWRGRPEPSPLGVGAHSGAVSSPLGAAATPALRPLRAHSHGLTIYLGFTDEGGGYLDDDFDSGVTTEPLP